MRSNWQGSNKIWLINLWTMARGIIKVGEFPGSVIMGMRGALHRGGGGGGVLGGKQDGKVGNSGKKKGGIQWAY
ncbi:hypothetical protein O181_073514, partial [Austropuccinia psidii MF-1]|nr:hypothetical protein [Austropuccinia psidii MF-1]